MTTRPVGQIEVWDNTPAKIYTITDFVNLYTREILTSGVGNFTFQVYSHKDFSGTYTYPLIDVGDTVKVWMDWDTVAGNPNFIGKVTKRSGPIKTPIGWLREISGLSQGEILLRRHKKNKFYTGTNASVIVAEWANDLSLGVGDITADARQPNIEVVTKPYFDLLRHISDYWVDGANKIKKDFWVDLDFDLVWKVRPLRTAGVESLGMSDFLVDPQVIRDVESVKNNIQIYGHAGNVGIPGDVGRAMPSDLDLWTVDLIGNWVEDLGTISVDAGRKKTGANSLKCVPELIEGTYYGNFRRDVSTAVQFFGNPKYQTVNFWNYLESAAAPTLEIRLFAPTSSDMFQADLGTVLSAQWTDNWKSFEMGKNQEYDSEKNPTGPWKKTGSPNWSNIQWVDFRYENAAANPSWWIDELYFGHGRFRGSASDLAGGGSSGGLYGQRDYELIDDKLKSDTECTQRAETILFMRKDLPIQIKIAVLGNDNVLVGDRLSMTIPSEAISAVNYYVFVVENTMNLDNWITQATMVNSVNTRQTLPSRPIDYIARAHRQLRELAMEEKEI